MATVFEAGLATATNPSQLDDGECPWARYGLADRSSWAAVLGPSLVVTDQSAARTILADPRFHQGIRVAMERNPGIDPRFLARRKEGLLLRDGPDHVRMRRLSTRAFTPRAADRHRPFMREVMERLADDVPAAGVCDAIETLTQTYPIHVICRVLGAPSEDIPMFSRVAETILNAQSGAPEFLEVGLAAHVELDDYVGALIERRRREPGPDLLTDLIQAEEDGGRLTKEEMLFIVVSVIMAGTDTTRNQLAIGLHLFADHPDQWAALGDGASIDVAVEEIIRFAPVGHVLSRVPECDVEVHGLTIPAGTMVIMNVGAANRDPQLDAADEFVPDRRPSPPHLGFGFGPKYCIGANLAKAELVEALTVLRARFSTIEHAGPARFRQVGFIQGPLELPLRLTRA